MSITVQQLVTDAKSRIRNLTPDEVAQRLDSGSPVLVDIREPGEAGRDGAIPGALPAPRGMLEFYADPASAYHLPQLDPAAEVILYCASGGRSALATTALETLGYRDVSHLDGGIKAWKEQGRPVTFDTV